MKQQTAQSASQLDSKLLALLQEELDGFNAHVQMLRAFRAGSPFVHCVAV